MRALLARASSAGDGLVVRVVAALAFGTALAAARLRRLAPRRPWRPTRRLAITGTFHNTSWFLSHAVPLTRSGLEEVLVVADEPQVDVAGVRFVCPPTWLARVLGRPLAKLLWLLKAGARYRPDAYMGYHIIPNSVAALVAGSVFSRPACYQMTGGPIEVLGGGIDSENSWMTRLGRPSRFLERLALAVVREFDLVVVRGTSARRFLAERGKPDGVVIIPGSVDPGKVQPSAERLYDLLYLGRLTETKRPLEFVEIAAALGRTRPRLRAVMVGDGPLRDDVRSRAEALGIAESIELVGKQSEVAGYLGRSRVFLLTSRSEGLSIAMAEAMMAGVVPVVARVGDLADLVRDGENGYLVEPGDRERFVAVIHGLLEDAKTWRRLSEAARASALGYVGLEHVSALWARHLDELVGRHSAGAQ